MKFTGNLFVLLFCALAGGVNAQNLHKLQQEFVNLRFGMFIHYNIPTYMDEDWADPEASPDIFNPSKLDCNQWAEAARAANMSYGCLTTKHHSGFCIWDTKTTDYNVMNSPCKRDVVREYADAFRRQGLKVMLYYSILDTHHRLRPGRISSRHIEMIKAQLAELLTNYGEITALIIDGWDAPWSRISYDEIPFEDIYHFVKSLQPNCLLMDLNAAKYPADALYYTDIKSYEQGAGQHISKETNRLPALSCLPINSNWFWKESFPVTPVKKAEEIVNDNIIPFNRVYCNFILNVAPNRDGLVDDNAVDALRKTGDLWKNTESYAQLPPNDGLIISSDIIKHKPSDSSWSHDMNIMDFANDDDFTTAWRSNPVVEKPWIEFELDREQPFNMVTIHEGRRNGAVRKYRIDYMENNVWKTLLTGENEKRTKIERFPGVWGNKIRITFEQFDAPPAIAEIGVYNEKR
ncbi:MAG: alpha-L-fucosidase [Tannerella sp.]|jgi:alpha-L-fucosidase|nr:alpha-L-fucosidase [Tannerella sp.]